MTHASLATIIWPIWSFGLLFLLCGSVADTILYNYNYNNFGYFFCLNKYMKPALIIGIVIVIIVIIIIFSAQSTTGSDTGSLPPDDSKSASIPKPPALATDCKGANASYQFVGNVIKPGTTIKTCQGMQSSDKSAIFVHQSDTNLVIYDTASGKPIWASNTVNGIDRNGKLPFRFVYQEDSNLVLYDADNKVMWASNTNGKPSTDFVMQEDMNAVLYANAPVHNGSSWSGPAVWGTNTSKPTDPFSGLGIPGFPGSGIPGFPGFPGFPVK
jgi:hypothetical protein